MWPFLEKQTSDHHLGFGTQLVQWPRQERPLRKYKRGGLMCERLIVHKIFDRKFISFFFVENVSQGTKGLNPILLIKSGIWNNNKLRHTLVTKHITPILHLNAQRFPPRKVTTTDSDHSIIQDMWYPPT